MAKSPENDMSKAERMRQVVQKAHENEQKAKSKPPVDSTPTPSSPSPSAHVPKSQPQPEVGAKDQSKVQDQKGASEKKTKRKLTEKVLAFRNQPELPLAGIIKILSEKNPKKRKAGERFSLYKDGQSVAQYIAASKADGNTESQAKADIRWDYTCKFINVT